MTKIEKQTVINALKMYADYWKEQSGGEAAREYNEAKAELIVFESILNEPAGSCKI